MNRKLSFASSAWSEYLEWQAHDKKTLKRINTLIKSILRTPFEGLGNPEPLKGNLSGYWSREINEKDRLVYEVTEKSIEIIQLENHYGDK